MDATQAKQIADALNIDNTAELDAIMQSITSAAYQGFYYVDCAQKLSEKTCFELNAKGFTVMTSGDEMRVLWDIPTNS